jgi:hypothetical protein
MQLMEFQKSLDLENSVVSSDSFFDTLQSWALNFVQLVFEPVANQFQRLQSSVELDDAMLKSSATEMALEQTKFQDSATNSLKTFDTAAPSNPAQKQSLEKKMRADVAFIVANVSSSHFGFVLLSHFCRRRFPSCAFKQVVFLCLNLT